MRCPICGDAAKQDHRPFCGKACADRDLLNWLHGRYAVPVPEDDEDAPDPLDSGEAGAGRD